MSRRSPDLRPMAALSADAGTGTARLRIPIARTVPLADAIPVLTELEHHGTPRGGKLIITAG